MRRIRTSLVASGLLAATPFTSALSDVLKEPPVFKSSGGVLDILMIARPKVVPELSLLSGAAPTAWVYEICPRAFATGDACPATGPNVSTEYGGTRLAIKQGDRLKVRLVNKLPPLTVDDAKHIAEFGGLAGNPINLHTHGLVVEPRTPSTSRKTYGDYVFVLGFPNTSAGLAAASGGTHNHGDATFVPIEYEIDLPANHPSGPAWFHPHIHGISLNQVSAGLAGIISVGEVGDYTCEDRACTKPWPAGNVRHLILKDTQIEDQAGTAHLMTQQDPTFCDPPAANEIRQGSCPGRPATVGDPGHPGGKWILSVNGQVYPTIPVTSPTGEIWRLQNASGSASYDLHLVANSGPNAGQDMVFQVVSIDGTSINGDSTVPPNQQTAIGGGKMKAVACPISGVQPDPLKLPVCATSIKMMPSSRAELRVIYRDATGKVATPAGTQTAVFKTIGFDATGDQWPAADLANVQFSAPGVTTAATAPVEYASVRGQAYLTNQAGGIFTNAAALAGPSNAPTNCMPTALKPGQRRRIYYGNPYAALGLDGFGLGYEIVDIASGRGVPGTFVPVKEFDPQTPVVCLQLGPLNTPVKEQWELVNVSGEYHNFHIHQTKFRVVDGTKVARPGRPLLATLISLITKPLLPFPRNAVLHDNLPLPNGNNCDGSVEAWQAGTCDATPVIVEIPFSQSGDFVYHCHILEHEDGGMMAKISVLRR